MRLLKIIILFLVLCFITVGCVNKKEEENLNDSSGENSAHINHLIGYVKEIRSESFVITTIEEASSTQNSDSLDIPRSSKLYVFIPFEDTYEEIQSKIGIGDKIQVSYTNIAITNGIYTLTMIDSSQLVIKDK